jgi:hypothetical protein
MPLKTLGPIGPRAVGERVKLPPLGLLSHGGRILSPRVESYGVAAANFAMESEPLLNIARALYFWTPFYCVLCF